MKDVLKMANDNLNRILAALELADKLALSIRHSLPCVTPCIEPEKIIEIISLADEYTELRQSDDPEF